MSKRRRLTAGTAVAPARSPAQRLTADTAVAPARSPAQRLTADTAAAPEDVSGIRRALLTWYRRSARDLPWRRTRDPYRIWLSEILLQQTRVETAQPYYERFVAAFPTVADLAAAPLNQVLKLWAGLGYYRRARNLHRAAQVITHERGGRFPLTAAGWLELPGIGRYTAGAIASITASEPFAAVDGNVKRVLARLFCIQTSIDDGATQAEVWRLAEMLLSRSAPGDSNQALMDLGARICTPRRPQCADCPVQRWCAAFAAGEQERLPIRRRKRPVPHIEAVVAAVRHRGRYLLVQRPSAGLLAGYWTLPGGEIASGESHTGALQKLVYAATGADIGVGEELGTVLHVFSHRRLNVHVYAGTWLRDQRPVRRSGTVRWVTPTRLADYPLATIDRKLLAVAQGSRDRAFSMRRPP